MPHWTFRPSKGQVPLECNVGFGHLSLYPFGKGRSFDAKNLLLLSNELEPIPGDLSIVLGHRLWPTCTAGHLEQGREKPPCKAFGVKFFGLWKLAVFSVSILGSHQAPFQPVWAHSKPAVLYVFFLPIDGTAPALWFSAGCRSRVVVSWELWERPLCLESFGLDFSPLLLDSAACEHGNADVFSAWGRQTPTKWKNDVRYSTTEL